MVHAATMIKRRIDEELVKTALRRSRIVAILGPRQCGKTTLARAFVAPGSLNYFDLEDPASLARLTEPATALAQLITVRSGTGRSWPVR
jgi:predicted AAA+ superfamily ATPase